MFGRMAIAAFAAMVPAAAEAAPPAPDCSKLDKGTIAALVCGTPLLAALDAEVARLYALALGAPGNPNRNDAMKEQTAWLAERAACRTTPAVADCVRERYLERITALRIGWRAARREDDKGITRGPVTYRCEGIDGYVNVTFIQADEPIAWIQRKDIQEMLLAKPSTGGARYEGLTPEHFFWVRSDDTVYHDINADKDATCQVEPMG